MKSPDLRPDTLLTIDTPENVAFGYEVAGIGSRFIAALVDTLLIFALQLVIILVAQIGTSFLDGLSAYVGAALALISFVFIWGYYIFFELRWNGRTPGKRLIGIRAIRTDGTPIGFAESAIRNLVRIVDLLPGTYAVGVVTMFIDEQSRRLGDLAAGTLVIYDHSAVTLDSLAAGGHALPNAPFVPRDETYLEDVLTLPLEQLSEADVAMAEALLQRAEQLTTRSQLVHQITTIFQQRLGLPEHRLDETVALRWIGHVVRAYRHPRGAE